MTITKDTMPETYETKDGKIAFLIGFSPSKPVKENDNIVIGIDPALILKVDDKNSGEFECHSEVTVKSSLSKEEIYAAFYKLYFTAMDDFDKLIRTKFAIPKEAAYKIIPYENIKKGIPDLFKDVL